MSREVHVRFSESARVKFPRATQPEPLQEGAAVGDYLSLRSACSFFILARRSGWVKRSRTTLASTLVDLIVPKCPLLKVTKQSKDVIMSL